MTRDKIAIRSATLLDARATLDIYSPHILQSATSFELTCPNIEDWEGRMSEVLEKYPWLVLTVNNTVAGYAYACEHRARVSYQWSVESSVYFSPKYQRRGFARLLLKALYLLLVKQGFYNVYAGVTLPNQGSVRLHESLGFEPVGVYRNVGFKNNVWHDVGWWQRPLQNLSNLPQSPVPFSKLKSNQIEETIGGVDLP